MVFGDHRTVRDGARQMLVVREGIDHPAIRQRAGKAELEERTQRRPGLVHVIDAVVIADDLGALPRDSGARDQ